MAVLHILKWAQFEVSESFKLDLFGAFRRATAEGLLRASASSVQLHASVNINLVPMAMQLTFE